MRPSISSSCRTTLGAGKSSKPSDGLRTKFPRYNYADLIGAHHRLVTEGLGIKHLRLVMGNSMGGMHTWLWGVTYPDFMDALVPMAAQPTEMSSRNWMTRRMMIELIRTDPEWNGGNYTSQPTLAPPRQHVLQRRHQRRNAPLSKARARLARRPTSWSTRCWRHRPRPTPTTSSISTNSSRDYNAAPGLERIKAALLAINAMDDERNPTETGIMEREIKRVKNGKLYLIPASDDTRGHGTTGMAKFYKQQLKELLDTAPRRTM